MSLTKIRWKKTIEAIQWSKLAVYYKEKQVKDKFPSSRNTSLSSTDFFLFLIIIFHKNSFDINNLTVKIEKEWLKIFEILSVVGIYLILFLKEISEFVIGLEIREIIVIIAIILGNLFDRNFLFLRDLTIEHLSLFHQIMFVLFVDLVL